jgi:hypothetical protein
MVEQLLAEYNVKYLDSTGISSRLDNVQMKTHLFQNLVHESIANITKELRFGVLITANIKSTVSQYVALHTPLDGYQYFTETFCLHH